MTTTTPHSGGTPLQHGKRTTYTHHHCRCHWCINAEQSYQQARKRRIAYGTWQGRVDAEPARQHVQALAAAGLSERQIATQTGVTHTVILRLVHGASGQPPSRTMRPANAAAILAIPVPGTIDRSGRRLIDATGARRRLQAVAAAGWPLLAAAGRDKTVVRTWRLIRAGYLQRITPATDGAIRDAYDRLWDRDPALSCRVGDVRASTELAAKHRWAPALAWDDDAIDDPAAVPDWTARCGTPGGYYDHSQIGTPTCQRCRDAVNAAASERKLRRRQRQAA